MSRPGRGATEHRLTADKIVATRLAVGGAMLGLILAVRRQSIRAALRAVPIFAFVGLAGAALPWIGQAWAQQSSTRFRWPSSIRAPR